MNIQCPNCQIVNGIITAEADLHGYVHYNTGSGTVKFIGRDVKVRLRNKSPVLCNHCGYTDDLKNFIQNPKEVSHVPD